ncbi:hypothetical protein B9479_006055 [Cryptococcus floricola]|uniref:Ubiquitin-like protease family profile domain-containing protein n=1 Tax=Cryptococcus floricola TaxID=2591691 RepID=A0A5D3ATE1_9TREE|nr:hypothetical protein B9479_006055 [Cryptococcus floricola]
MPPRKDPANSNNKRKPPLTGSATASKRPKTSSQTSRQPDINDPDFDVELIFDGLPAAKDRFMKDFRKGDENGTFDEQERAIDGVIRALSESQTPLDLARNYNKRLDDDIAYDELFKLAIKFAPKARQKKGVKKSKQNAATVVVDASGGLGSKGEQQRAEGSAPLWRIYQGITFKDIDPWYIAFKKAVEAKRHRGVWPGQDALEDILMVAVKVQEAMAMVREEVLAVQESSLADLLKDPDARAAVKAMRQCHQVSLYKTAPCQKIEIGYQAWLEQQKVLKSHSLPGEENFAGEHQDVEHVSTTMKSVQDKAIDEQMVTFRELDRVHYKAVDTLIDLYNSSIVSASSSMDPIPLEEATPGTPIRSYGLHAAASQPDQPSTLHDAMEGSGLLGDNGQADTERGDTGANGQSKKRKKDDMADPAASTASVVDSHLFSIRVLEAHKGKVNLDKADKERIRDYLTKRLEQDIDFCLEHNIRYPHLLRCDQAISGPIRKPNSWNNFQKSDSGKQQKTRLMAETTPDATSQSASTTSQSVNVEGDASKRSDKQREVTDRLKQGTVASSSAYAAAQKELGLQGLAMPDVNAEEAMQHINRLLHDDNSAATRRHLADTFMQGFMKVAKHLHRTCQLDFVIAQMSSHDLDSPGHIDATMGALAWLNKYSTEELSIRYYFSRMETVLRGKAAEDEIVLLSKGSRSKGENESRKGHSMAKAATLTGFEPNITVKEAEEVYDRLAKTMFKSEESNKQGSIASSESVPDAEHMDEQQDAGESSGEGEQGGKKQEDGEEVYKQTAVNNLAMTAGMMSNMNREESASNVSTDMIEKGDTKEDCQMLEEQEQTSGKESAEGEVRRRQRQQEVVNKIQKKRELWLGMKAPLISDTFQMDTFQTIYTSIKWPTALSNLPVPTLACETPDTTAEEALHRHGQDMGLGSARAELIKNSTSLWTDGIIEDLLEKVLPLKSEMYSSQYIKELFYYNTRNGGCDWKGDVPLPLLGEGTGWRQKVILTVIPNKAHGLAGNHWLTVVIFGPQRLVAIFDGAGGKWDTEPERINAILQSLQDRLNYELECGLVDGSQNRDWQMPKSTPLLRDTCLEWVVQTDNHSCGPLAVLVGCLVLRGIRPTRKVIEPFLDRLDVSKGQHVFKNAHLRDWVLQVVRACCKDEGA